MGSIQNWAGFWTLNV